MKEFFLELPIKDLDTFLIKVFCLPILVFLIFYIVYFISMQIFKNKKGKVLKDFKIKCMIMKSYSALFTLFLLVIYFASLVWYNSTDKFEWGAFPWEIVNLYFQLIPFIISIVVLGIIHRTNNESIKKYI